jgi:hypothetical protein
MGEEGRLERERILVGTKKQPPGEGEKGRIEGGRVRTNFLVLKCGHINNCGGCFVFCMGVNVRS